MNIRNFYTNINDTLIHGDVLFTENISNVLCLHGGGKRGRAGLQRIRELLAVNNISSYSFDYIGHGETGGNISSTSLKDKVHQTIAVINSEKIQKPLTLIASSMGGYIAIKMTELYNVENLILIAPAVYTKEAYTIKFDSQFSSIIRESMSWINSDSWEIIKNYKGNLLIFKAENDQIIPRELIEKLYSSAINVKKIKVITVPRATHPLTDWLNENKIDSDLVIETITEFIHNKEDYKQ